MKTWYYNLSDFFLSAKYEKKSFHQSFLSLGYASQVQKLDKLKSFYNIGLGLWAQQAAQYWHYINHRKQHV